MRDDLFDNHWIFYVIKTDEFAHAAHCLEEIVNYGDKVWKDDAQIDLNEQTRVDIEQALEDAAIKTYAKKTLL